MLNPYMSFPPAAGGTLGTPLHLGSNNSATYTDPFTVATGVTPTPGSVVYVVAHTNKNGTHYVTGVTSGFSTDGWAEVTREVVFTGQEHLWLSVWRAKVVSGTGDIDISFAGSWTRCSAIAFEIPDAAPDAVQTNTLAGTEASSTVRTISLAAPVGSGNYHLSAAATDNWSGGASPEAGSTLIDEENNNRWFVEVAYLDDPGDADFDWTVNNDFVIASWEVEPA